MGLITQKWKALRDWFIKLGFWKKLILIFTINTIIILIVMNVLMGVLFGRVNTNMTTISSTETKDYISISNSLVGNSLVNSFLVGLEVLADFIVRIDSSVHFFQNRTNIYNSLQSGVPIYNPPLSSQMASTPNFRKSMIYFYNQNATFHNQPYVDVLLASLFSGIEQQQVKRTNVIYQSVKNSSNIFVRSTPGTNDFVISSIESINERFNSLTKDWITISGLYTDSLTKSSDPGNLVALRTVNYQGDYRVLIEVEAYQQSVIQYFSKLYYYPSAQIILFKITQQNPPQYQIINRDSFSLNLSDCFKSTVLQYDLGNGTVLNAYSVAVNQTFQFGQSPAIIPHQQLSNMSDTVGTFRIVLIVDKQELSVPNTFMTTFINNQSSTLSYIIYGWSFVILLATIGLSIVTGNYIFSNLKTLSQKLEQYTKSPHKIHQIILELKELECYGIIKKLIDNVSTIIQKIEEKKKNKNQIISPMIYPPNIAQKQFIHKVSLPDEQKWQQWEKLLQEAQIRFKQRKKRI